MNGPQEYSASIGPPPMASEAGSFALHRVLSFPTSKAGCWPCSPFGHVQATVSVCTLCPSTDMEKVPDLLVTARDQGLDENATEPHVAVPRFTSIFESEFIHVDLSLLGAGVSNTTES